MKDLNCFKKEFFDTTVKFCEERNINKEGCMKLMAHMMITGLVIENFTDSDFSKFIEDLTNHFQKLKKTKKKLEKEGKI